MAGVFQKAKVWLGLAPDDEYDDTGYSFGYSQAHDEQRAGPAPSPMGPSRPLPGQVRQPARPRPVPDAVDEPQGAPSRQPRSSGSVRTLAPSRPTEHPDRSSRMSDTPTVRPMRTTSAKPTVIAPTGFDEAKDIADRFKADQPVVMDLRGADRELARRLIDFSSGICYALGGHMEKVGSGTYLITPSNIDVSEVEKRRLRERT